MKEAQPVLGLGVTPAPVVRLALVATASLIAVLLGLAPATWAQEHAATTAAIPSGGLFGETLRADGANAVVAGPEGVIYVAGSGYAQRDDGLITLDASVMALTSEGRILWQTWLGGTRDYRLDPTCAEPGDGGECDAWTAHPRGLGGADEAIAIDRRGDRLLVAGHTYSVDFPTKGVGRDRPYLDETPTTRSRRDAFVAILDASSGEVVSAQYLGGDDDDEVRGARFLDDNRFVVFGSTRSSLGDVVDLVVGSVAPRLAGGPAVGWATLFESVGTEAAPEWSAVQTHILPGPSRITLGGYVEVPDETWLVGDEGGRLIVWRRSRAEVEAREPGTISYLSRAGTADVRAALRLASDGTSRSGVAVVGSTSGDVYGADGAACDEVVGALCGGAACADTNDVFVARLAGGHCQRVTYLGGSGRDQTTAATYWIAESEERSAVAVVGHTTSRDFSPRSGFRAETPSDDGVGQDAFYAVVDVDSGEVASAGTFGRRLDDGGRTGVIDDVLTGVTVLTAQELAVVGASGTGFGRFGVSMADAQDPAEGDLGQVVVARVPARGTDLGVSIELVESALSPRAQTTLLLHVHNNGGADVRAGEVQISLGSHDLAFTPTDDCFGTSVLLRCKVRDSDVLPAGAERVFPITVTAPAEEGAVIIRAWVDGSSFEVAPADNAAEATLVTGAVDLGVAFAPRGTADAPALVGLDGSGSVRVTVENRGYALRDATLRLESAQGAALPLVMTGLPPECVAGPGGLTPVRCSVSDVALGAPWVFDVELGLSAAGRDTLGDQLEVRAGLVAIVGVDGEGEGGEGPTDVVAANDRVSTLLSFVPADLESAGGGTAPRAVGLGEAFTLRLQGRNAGPGPARIGEVVLQTDLDYGPLSAICSRAGRTITCAGPAAPAAEGELVTWRIPLVAPGGAAGGGASIEDEIAYEVRGVRSEADVLDNAGVVPVVFGGIDVRVEAPTPRPEFRAGSAESVAWSIQNAGEADATGVIVVWRATHPRGVALDGALLDGAPCAVTSGLTEVVATCVLDVLAGGQTVTLDADVTADGAGTLVQRVELAAEQTSVSAEVPAVELVSTVTGADLVAILEPPASAPVRGDAWPVAARVRNDGGVGTGDAALLTVTFEGSFEAGAAPDASTCAIEGGAVVGYLRYRCAVSVEPGDTSAPLVFAPTPLEPGPVRVSAYAADASEPAGDSENGGDSLAAIVLVAELGAEWTAPSVANIGAPIAVDLRVRNDGALDVSEARVEVTWSAASGLALSGAVPDDCEAAPEGLTCSVTLPVGASVDLGFSVLTERSGLHGLQAQVVPLGARAGEPVATSRATVFVDATEGTAPNVLDCGGLTAEVIYDEAAGPTPTVLGFTRDADGAWVLDAADGTLTLPQLELGDDVAALRVAWTASGDPVSAGETALELRRGGGSAWATVRGTLFAEPASRVAEIGAPGDGPVRLRWLARGGATEALALSDLQVVACRSDVIRSLTLEAAERLVVGERGDLLPVRFDLTAGDEDLTQVEVVFALVPGDVLLWSARIEGGVCESDGPVRLICRRDTLGAGEQATVALEFAADGEALGGVRAFASARSILDTSSPRLASTYLRFGEPPREDEFTITPPSGSGIDVPRPRPDLVSTIVTLGREGHWGLTGGVLVFTPSNPAILETDDERCEVGADEVRCAVPASNAESDEFAVVFTLANYGSVPRVYSDWYPDGGAPAPWVPTDAVVSEYSGRIFFRGGPSGPYDVGFTTFAECSIWSCPEAFPHRVDMLFTASPNIELLERRTGAVRCLREGEALRCRFEGFDPPETFLDIPYRTMQPGPSVITAQLLGYSPPRTLARASFTWVSNWDCARLPCPEGDCQDYTCSSSRGCELVPRDGTVCEAAATCLADAACIGTTCAPLGVEDCDDSDECTAEYCDDGAGCVYELVASESCDCALRPERGECGGGEWRRYDGCGDLLDVETCDDGDECTADACDAELGCTYAQLDTTECVACEAGCDDRECGPDPVCGESCGSCEAGSVCAFGLCIDDPCDELQAEGCCDGDVLSRCVDGTFEQVDCADVDAGCGWNDEEAAFACDGADPVPDDIDPVCPWVPECDDDLDCDAGVVGDVGVDAGTGDLGVGDSGGGDAGVPDAGAGDAGDAGGDVADVDEGAVDGSDDAEGSGGAAGLGAPQPTDGCTCTSSGSGSSPRHWLLAVGLALVGCRRRRSALTR